MTTQIFGKSIKRNEDPRLLTGNALFVDDVHLPDMLHAHFVRSPYAHARITNIDASAALETAGVVAVYTADDLGDYWQQAPLLVPPPPLIERLTFHKRTQVPLAKDKVRFVGEPVVLVIATSRYIAEDACERIWIEYDPLTPVVDIEAALTAQSALVHDDLDSNLAAHVIQERGDYNKARRDADLVIKRSFTYDRGTAAAMENRGIVANWDPRSDVLTMWDTTQAPIVIRNGIAAMLSLSESQVRLVAPFLGGGFGPKVMMFYQEEVIIPWASMQLARPIKWIEDRRTNFYATSQERNQTHDSEIALRHDGTILGVKDVFIHDTGAYDPYGLTVPINTQCTLLGPYKVENYYSEFSVAFTNKPIVAPYRGAGRQHGVFVMERLLDIAAKELSIDRVEIRRRNLIPPDAFPYNNEIIYQDFAPLRYDSGNYEASLDLAMELVDYNGWIQSEKERLHSEDKLAGLGFVAYVEGTGIGPYEGARITVGQNGKVSIATGVGTQGQGHYTSFAQIASEQLGVDISDVHLTTGDTAEFHWGAGTFASRGATVAGNAVHAAATRVRDKILKLASEQLDNVPQEELELVGGSVQIKGVPESAIALGVLAAAANPTRGAVKPGTEPGLEATEYFGPEMGATASGIHVMVVEVDPRTWLVDIKRYVVVHDCGTLINPMIVDGQIHGGVAQGIGNAFYEQLVWDDNGQLLNASFMDYLLPTATDVPPIETGHIETPSPLNPLGIKGVGEAGCIPSGACFAQAIEDALSDYGVEITEIPLSPNRLFELVQEKQNTQ